MAGNQIARFIEGFLLGFLKICSAPARKGKKNDGTANAAPITGINLKSL
jgi:hypothetical protein